MDNKDSYVARLQLVIPSKITGLVFVDYHHLGSKTEGILPNYCTSLKLQIVIIVNLGTVCSTALGVLAAETQLSF